MSTPFEPAPWSPAPWLVERAALGELDGLPPSTRDAVRAWLETDAGRAALAALRDDDDALLRAHPPAAVVARLGSAARAAPSRRRAAMLLLPALAASVVAVAVLARVEPAPDAGGGTGVLEPTRLKGLRPALRAYRQEAGGPAALDEGAAIRARDVLQLAYTSAARPFGTVVSLDGRGAVTVHLPPVGGQAAPLARAGETALPSAYELDDAPAFERFFLVTGERPFHVAPVVAAARALGARPGGGRDQPLPLEGLPGGLEQTSLTLIKVPR